VYYTYYEKSNTVYFNGASHPLNQFISTPWGNMMVIPNKYFVPGTPVIHPMYFSLVLPQNMAGSIIGGLGVVSANQESSVVNLTYADESPQRAVDVLNAVVAVYNDAAINDKNQQATNTMKFLDERLQFVENDLDSVEGRLERFRASNRIIDISTQGQQYLQSVSANDGQITNLDIQLSVLDKVQQYVQSKEKNKEAIVPALTGITDPILTDQFQRLYEAEALQARLSGTTGKNFPTRATADQEIARLRPLLLENLRSQRQNLLASRGNFANANNRFNSLLSSLPAQERALINIDRQQKIKNTIYTFLLQKREEAALTFASQVADSRLVNDAQAGGIISPNRQNVYLQWIISAIVLGAVFIFIRENLNRNILSRTEVEKITVAPVVAEIAFNKSSEAVVVEQGSRTLIAEQFRYLRTSLNYIGIGVGKKKILFTSSISGEGKSFITTNLGATLAITGKKVVVLEMDLRKPKLSEMLNLDKNTGLSDYFIGSKTITEIVKSTQVPNMSLISSGAIPPNPAELLMNGRLPELLNELEAMFDYVLIDTAPVSPVTDAYIISPYCDATLYVVRQGRTPRVLIQKLNDLLRNKRLKNLSIVFNGVKQKRFGSYYGYGYTYGYGYLDEKGSKKKKSK
jgi:capsular exopolysaccharide synthesis family protein